MFHQTQAAQFTKHSNFCILYLIANRLLDITNKTEGCELQSVNPDGLKSSNLNPYLDTFVYEAASRSSYNVIIQECPNWKNSLKKI